MQESVKNTIRLMVHPIDTLSTLKHKHYKNLRFVCVIMALFFLVRVLARQCYGFRFSTTNPNDFSLLVQFATSAIPLFLFCLTNWCVSSITDGEGKLSEILTVVSMSIVPYLLLQLIAIGLSNILALDEGFFLSWMIIIGMLWSAFLAFQSIRIIHDFTTGKTIFTIIITVCGVVIILFIMLLIFTLFQQLTYFIRTIYSEIMFKR